MTEWTELKTLQDVAAAQVRGGKKLGGVFVDGTCFDKKAVLK